MWSTEGRVDRFTATGSLVTTPIVEDDTPVSQSADEDWLARGHALLNAERRKGSHSSSPLPLASVGLEGSIQMLEVVQRQHLLLQIDP